MEIALDARADDLITNEELYIVITPHEHPYLSRRGDESIVIRYLQRVTNPAYNLTVRKENIL